MCPGIPKPCESAKALALMKHEGKVQGWTNLGQSYGRMGWTQHVPCITPKGNLASGTSLPMPLGEFYDLEKDRFMTGIVFV